MSIKDLINSAGAMLFTSDISTARVLVVLIMALLFGIYVFFVYRIAVNNEFYSKDFNKSLTITAVITAAIVLTVQSNLVISLGMVGALSIVRFRTAIKSSLDLVFLFWSISLGIICGAGLFEIAIVLCIVVTIVMFVLEKIESPVSLGLLVIKCKNVEKSNNIINEIKPLTSFLRLKNKTITKDNVELVLEYKSKDKEFDTKLSKIKDIDKYSILNHDRETRL